jgi:hypothetical protein
LGFSYGLDIINASTAASPDRCMPQFMPQKLLLILLLATLLKCNSQRQNINADLSKLFFKVDVTVLNSALLDKFSMDTTLHKFPIPKEDTVYYPLRNNEAKYIVQHTFKFENNKYIKAQFLEGYLGVILGRSYDDKDITVLFLSLSFKTQSDLDTCYSQILERFKKLGKLEIESKPEETAVITNIEYEKRFEIIKLPFPPNNPDQFILYLYLKKLKR